MKLPEPTIKYVRRRLESVKDDPDYYGAEGALELVFRQWPENASYDHVIIKTIMLNRAYSTRIYDVWTVARHIRALDIDERLRRGDETLIHEIASVTFKDKQRNFYSFATKYCSWHEPEKYQIYDSYVDWLVWNYQKQFRFGSFRRYELLEYPRFVQIVHHLKDRFGLATLSNKELDKFLWIEGWMQMNASTAKA